MFRLFAATHSTLLAVVLSVTLSASLAFVLGCKTVKAGTPAALPALAVDQTDATANEVLQAAHGFAASVSADVIAGKLVLTDSQKQGLVTLNKALNVADAAEIAYHGCGGGTKCAGTTLVAAVTSVETSLTTVTSELVVAATK